MAGPFSGILPYRSHAQITPGSAVPPGQGVAVAVTTAGTQNLKLSGGATIQLTFAVGTSILDNWAVTDAPIGGTAVATVSTLYC